MSDDEGQILLDPMFEGSLSSTSTYILKPLSVGTRSTTPLPNPENHTVHMKAKLISPKSSFVQLKKYK